MKKYYFWAKIDNLQDREAFDHAMEHIGYDGTLTTLVAKYPYIAFQETILPTQEFAMLDDDGTASAFRTLVWNAHTVSTTSTGFTVTPTFSPTQLVMVRDPIVTPELGAGPPAEDAVQMRHHKIIDLWLPGSLFGHRGYIKYADAYTDLDLAGNFEYNLLFSTYSNFKTWTYAGTGSDDPIMLEVNDFQSVMYFKDG